MKKIVLILLVIASLMANSQTWTKVEGTSAFINAIHIPDNTGRFFVSSDIVPADFQSDAVQFPYFGVGQNGFKIFTDKGNTYGDEILKDYSVYAFFAYPDNPRKMLASIRQYSEGGIVESTDGGLTWDLNDIRCLGSSQIVDITSTSNGEFKLVGARINSSKGYVFSTNDFKDCNTDDQFVIQARAIKVSPFDSKLLFIGGNKSLNHIYRSYDNGNTWLNDESGLENLRILCIMPSQWDAAVIYAGVDSLDYNKVSYGKGIYQSLDTGKTWKLVGAEGKRVFSIAQHPTNKKLMAAACDSGSVFFSGSYGYGWEEYSSGIPKDASVRVISITPWENQGFIALAGTFGMGLYKSNLINTDIVEFSTNQLKVLGISPLPFDDILRIDIASESSEKISCEVLDIYGKVVYSRNNLIPNGIITLEIMNTEILTGAYFLRIYNGSEVIVRKIMRY